MATFKAKDGTQIYYKDCGAGKPVLFSHGWPLDGDMWDSQLNYLAERGFRTIAFDRRGFGRSDQPWNGYDYDTFASDINDLITTLDLQDVTLVGFSMGGGDVTRYINNYGSARVAGLALLGTISGSLYQALSHEAERDAAIVTFLTTASGVTILGIGSALWGLVLGGVCYALFSRARRA